MSKPTDNILIVPGESGWEIWSGNPGAGFTLTSATPHQFPGEITDIPGGEIILLFPVKSITAIPMRVTSDDDALFADLAALHGERLGLRPDPMAGQLTDVFVIAKEPENTALLSIQLRSPSDADITPRGPKEFEVSARALPLQGDCVAIWKELGRWVFAIAAGGNLVYCQATSVSSHAPDDDLIREIRISLIQLSLQGIEIDPAKVLLWTSDKETSTALLTAGFKVPVDLSPRPAPVLPDPRSKLLPADVRAARKAAEKRRNILIAAGAAAVIYLGLIGWLGYGLWKDHSRTKTLLAAAENAAPDAAAYTLHIQKWDELALAIDVANSPIDILYRISRAIPPSVGLRLRTAEISAAEVKLIGEAQQPGPVNQFSLNLTKSNDLTTFKWSTPPPQQSTRGWEFNYNGTSTVFGPQEQ